MAYYDEDGNIVEGILTPEEAQVLKEERESTTKALDEAKERLSKLETKDFNFRKLESMTQEEIAKLSTREIEVQKQIEEIAKQQQDFSQKQIDFTKKKALSLVAGHDEELQAKVLTNYDRIKDEATTEEEIARKMFEAYTLATGSSPSVNPIAQAMTFTGGTPPPNKSADFSQTDRGKDLASSLGMSIAKESK